MNAEKGYRVRLLHSINSAENLAEGILGKVDHIDSMGALHVIWDDGRQSVLIPGVDNFTVYDDGYRYR